jgi:starvation-inducible DNA-binding protein
MTQAALQNEVTELSPEMGLRTEQRRAIAESLGDAVADAFRLYFNVQSLHWNVEGPAFYGIHKLTEEQYEALNASVDTIAERIRALGLPAPQSLSGLDERSVVEDLPVSAGLQDRIEALVRDYEKAGARLKKIVHEAEDVDDIRTADLLTDQLGAYEEFAWMLRATIAS